MGLQIVELHFSVQPKLDYLAVKERAEALLGSKIDTPSSRSGNVVLFYHQEHPVQLKDATIYPQTVLMQGDKPIDINGYTQDIQQSWGFPDCLPVLLTSKHTILVTEMMASSLRPNDRLRLFHAVLQSVIELANPIALVFKHSQQVVQPHVYLYCTDEAPIFRPGSLNIRFFNTTDSSGDRGDKLMDTRGLSEIGLHDLQCHFRNLDPNAVSNLLFNTALYIFENGQIIESGNTVAGIDRDSKWICQFENALIPPEREILDLNPGAPYAAGDRT